MRPKFFPNLIQDYVKLSESGEYYDVEIHVGKNANVKIFRTHMNILCHRSPFLKQALSSIEKNNNINVVVLSNISPETFQIVLKYIYSGVLLLNEKNPWDILKVLMAMNTLLLQEPVNYLQKHLTETKSKWLEQNFDFIYRTSFQYNLLELQQYCIDLMAKSPKKTFDLADFTLISENTLTQLIKRDDLQMREVEVWDLVLQWGLAQNPKLNPDPVSWTDHDFKKMEETLKNCLPLIRFFSLSPKEFSDKVIPFKKLLKPQLYDDLLHSYLDPSLKSNIEFLPSRNINEIIDSEIVNLNIVSIISRRIDRMNVGGKDENFKELHLPYKFELLLRGSRDGFTPKKFHELCDHKPNTVTFVKMKGSEEILGGYNPLEWNSSDNFGKSTESFIFSFKNKNELKDVIISNVKDVGFALRFHPKGGPYFGQDLVIHSSNESVDFDKSYYMYKHYEKRLRDSEGKFSMEDYEVYQILPYESEEGITDENETIEILRELAENGDADAQYKLAYVYNERLETEVNNPKATEIYKKLAEQGDFDSMFNLTYQNKKGPGNEINDVKTFELCKKLAKKGNNTAQNNLGMLYLEGEGTRRSVSKAIYWFYKASEQGNKLAEDNLGVCYELGVGVDKDETKAFEFYKKSSEKGDTNAKFHLGYCYVNGIGIEIDKNKGLELYNEAAKEGGDTKELSEVCYWYQKASGSDNKMALFKLGEFYELGKSVNKNGYKAFDYYKRSAEKGYIIGSFKLAHFYEHGIGTYPNKEKAFSLYKTAAEAGYSAAQKSLASLYERGEGTKQDTDHAVYWYKESIKNGCLTAEENLNKLILNSNYSFF